ncbi:MAG: glutathione S-transferase family protein [Pseudomonadota bacterium]
MFTIYGDRQSGNCLKVLYAANHLGLEHSWVDVDVLDGGARMPESLARNPAGQVPYVVFDDGRVLAQSNAILLYLGHDTALVPEDPWERAQVHQWLFWEQYSHEPAIAVCRFEMFYRGQTAAERDSGRVAKGEAALDLMDAHLAANPRMAGERLTVADIALIAYTRLAHEGGFDLAERSHVRRWIAEVEGSLAIGA